MSDQTRGLRLGVEPAGSERAPIGVGGLDGWPWGPLPPPEEKVRRFETAIAYWDRHVASCRECLHQGRWFCPDGERLTRRVASLRKQFVEATGTRKTISVTLALGRQLTWTLTAQIP